MGVCLACCSSKKVRRLALTANAGSCRLLLALQYGQLITYKATYTLGVTVRWARGQLPSPAMFRGDHAPRGQNGACCGSFYASVFVTILPFVLSCRSEPSPGDRSRPPVEAQRRWASVPSVYCAQRQSSGGREPNPAQPAAHVPLMDSNPPCRRGSACGLLLLAASLMAPPLAAAIQDQALAAGEGAYNPSLAMYRCGGCAHACRQGWQGYRECVPHGGTAVVP